MNTVQTERIGDFEISIVYDENAESPRTAWDNATKMVCFHGRYTLGDEHGYSHNDYNSWQEMAAAIIEDEKPLIIKPLYMYDHSGITISTGGFSCPWDSGQIGFVYITQKEVDTIGLDTDRLDEILEGEVEDYDKYLRGEVFGFKVYKIETCDKGHEHKELLDSCYGYYDEEDALSEAKGYIN